MGAGVITSDVQNFDVATTEATAKEFMNVGLGFDETQYGEPAFYSFAGSTLEYIASSTSSLDGNDSNPRGCRETVTRPSTLGGALIFSLNIHG